MPSLIQGYEYDIFISYRHNDNRSGWVTEFVTALQEELAATIKEPLSIYFDKNPHDGLLETHNVDKSLEGKLKCLIFIPIISQTYCDTKSFAWQHEFVAFNKLAKEGTPLSSGEGPGLPIKIHDLDAEDKTILENELGGVLRAIEFIHKSGGVNRPLNSKDDEVRTTGKVLYRDQVNKVANAVKEIISSLKNPINPTAQSAKSQQPKANGNPLSRKTIVLATLAIMVLMAIIYVASQFIGSPSKEPEIIDKSIAVLPFVNMSNDPEQEYFSDGMTDEVLNRLFRIGDLKVTSRTSSMKFKGAKLTAKEIAGQLGVTNILEGSVQKSGNRIKITVQLIDAITDTHLWSETYEREFKDVFLIQSEIAQGVAKGLSARLSASVKNRLSEIPTKNIEAYNLYLKGIYEILKVTPESMEIGLKMLNQAIALDPDYAMPYLGVALYYGASTDFSLAPNIAMPPLKIAAQTALAKDSTSADAHGQYGFYDLWYAWDWAKSRNELVKGIQLDDKTYSSHWFYSWLLSSRGNFAESLRESGRTVELEPMNSFLGANHALMYYYHGEFDQALRELDRVRSFDTNQPFEHFTRGQVYSKIGKLEEAITEQQLAHQLFSAPWSHARLAYAYAIAGKKKEAIAILDLLEKQSNTVYVASDVVASVYVALGDYDHAFQFLEKGINERAGWMIWLKVDPIWDPIRKDKRFISILEKMNLNN